MSEALDELQNQGFEATQKWFLDSMRSISHVGARGYLCGVTRAALRLLVESAVRSEDVAVGNLRRSVGTLIQESFAEGFALGIRTLARESGSGPRSLGNLSISAETPSTGDELPSAPVALSSLSAAEQQGFDAVTTWLGANSPPEPTAAVVWLGGAVGASVVGLVVGCALNKEDGGRVLMELWRYAHEEVHRGLQGGHS